MSFRPTVPPPPLFDVQIVGSRLEHQDRCAKIVKTIEPNTGGLKKYKCLFNVYYKKKLINLLSYLPFVSFLDSSFSEAYLPSFTPFLLILLYMSQISSSKNMLNKNRTLFHDFHSMLLSSLIFK